MPRGRIPDPASREPIGGPEGGSRERPPHSLSAGTATTPRPKFLLRSRRAVCFRVSRLPAQGSEGAAERPSSRLDPCLGANLSARRRLDRFRPIERQRRQDRPCHRCGRARSASRDPAPRHLHWVLVGSSRHGGASEHHARHAGSDLGQSLTLHVPTIRPTGLIDVGTQTK
jgi:hypothetical protein